MEPSNLIANGLIPTVAELFIEAEKASHDYELASEQRSSDYNSLSDRYACFLDEEVFPEIRKHVTIADGQAQRAIGGFGSGDICAFMVAWNRPKVFGWILAFCGGYVDICGGGSYPDLIIQSDPKPLRVLLQVEINARPFMPFRRGELAFEQSCNGPKSSVQEIRLSARGR